MKLQTKHCHFFKKLSYAWTNNNGINRAKSNRYAKDLFAQETAVAIRLAIRYWRFDLPLQGQNTTAFNWVFQQLFELLLKSSWGNKR
jgi:hypothetical protein